MTDHAHAASFSGSMLPRVSRSFALTIPQLPEPLAQIVGNAYLLCRVADSIEDEPGIPPASKLELHRLLPAAIDDADQAELVALLAAPQLTPATPDPEQQLVQNLRLITTLTRSFDPQVRTVISRCLRKMCDGMQQYESRTDTGLSDLNDLSRYCYYVAGVVGEMLTELFCHHDPRTAERRSDMLRLAPSFGQGLQMTNILKDVWEDLAEGRCWLPRSEFESAGADLNQLHATSQRRAVDTVINRLVRIALGHLQDGLEYTLCIPRRQQGMRRFCFWSIGLAVLTLQRIHANPGYTSGSFVKISRWQLTMVIGTSFIAGHSNIALRWLFWFWSRGIDPKFRTPHQLPRMENA